MSQASRVQIDVELEGMSVSVLTFHPPPPTAPPRYHSAPALGIGVRAYGLERGVLGFWCGV